jgi:hypothetical protein
LVGIVYNEGYRSHFLSLLFLEFELSKALYSRTEGVPTNSLPTQQPHSILSYHYRILYFGTKFEPFRSLYTGTEGVVFFLSTV